MNKTDELLNSLGYDLLDECRQALMQAGIGTNTPVLDIATGSGRMAGILSEFGHIVYTGDVSCDAFLKLRNRLGDLASGDVTFIPLDATQMPFPDDSFGAVVCANGLHEMDDPRAVLGEMTRVCSKDGRLVITDFNDNGFDVMDEVHLKTQGKVHSRGTITAKDINRALSLRFADVQHLSLALNHVWTASGKTACSDQGAVHSSCFACGDRNPRGLRLRFRPDGQQRVISTCVLGEEYQGYPGIVQGGVVSTLLDSAMTNCLFADGIEGMTVRLNVRFREPVTIGRSMTVGANLVRRRGRLYELKASIMQIGKRKATADAKFLEIPQNRRTGEEGRC